MIPSLGSSFPTEEPGKAGKESIAQDFCLLVIWGSRIALKEPLLPTYAPRTSEASNTRDSETAEKTDVPSPSLIFPTASDRPGFWSTHHSFLTPKSGQFSTHPQKYLHTATFCLFHRSTDKRLANAPLFSWHLSDSQGQPQTRQPGCSPLYHLVHEPDALHLSESLMSYLRRLPTDRRFTTCFQWLLPSAIDSSPSNCLVSFHCLTILVPLCLFLLPPNSLHYLLSSFCLLFFPFFIPMPVLIPCSLSHSAVSTITLALLIYSRQTFLASSMPFVLLNHGTVSYLIITSALPQFPTQSSLLSSCFSSSFST